MNEPRSRALLPDPPGKRMMPLPRTPHGSFVPDLFPLSLLIFGLEARP